MCRVALAGAAAGATSSLQSRQVWWSWIGTGVLQCLLSGSGHVMSFSDLFEVRNQSCPLLVKYSAIQPPRTWGLPWNPPVSRAYTCQLCFWGHLSQKRLAREERLGQTCIRHYYLTCFIVLERPVIIRYILILFAIKKNCCQLILWHTINGKAPSDFIVVTMWRKRVLDGKMLSFVLLDWWPKDHAVGRL